VGGRMMNFGLAPRSGVVVHGNLYGSARRRRIGVVSCWRHVVVVPWRRRWVVMTWMARRQGSVVVPAVVMHVN
jgi:hypothetical protein